MCLAKFKPARWICAGALMFFGAIFAANAIGADADNSDNWGGDESFAIAAAQLLADEDANPDSAKSTANGDDWGGEGDDYREMGFNQIAKSASAVATDGVFQQLFGPDFKITGGSLRYDAQRRAVIIRDYATVLIQGRRIRARNILFFIEREYLYAEGDVSVEEKNGSYLYCEQAYFNFRDGNGRALNVRLRSTQQSTLGGDALTEIDVSTVRPDVHTSDNVGILGGTEDALNRYDQGDDKRAVRMNVFAPDLRVVSQNHYDATNVWASPSNFAEPHWRIKSKAINVRAGEKVEAYHNLIKIGKVPVFYLPYMIYDLKYSWPYYRPAFGSDSHQGFYFLNRVGWQFINPEDGFGNAIDENGDPVKRYFQLDRIFGDADFRGKRGWGFGGEADYSMDFFGKGKGNLKAYEITESYTMSGEDERRAREDVEFRSEYWGQYIDRGFKPAYYGNETRYLIDWKHQHKFTDNFDVRANLHRYSDRDFYKEYFPSEWAANKPKTTNANLRYLDDLFTTDLTVQMRLNDYRSETEYLPRWTVEIPGLQLFENFPLYLENKLDLGFMRRRSDYMLTDIQDSADYRNLLRPEDRMRHNGKTPWVGRAHDEMLLSLPIDLRYLTIRPWGGGFVSGYTDGYRPRTMDTNDAVFNAATKWGVDFTTRFFGDWGENWTHIVEPKISFINHESPVTKRDDLYYFDEVDNYRKSRMLTAGLHQMWLKRDENGEERTFATLEVKTGAVLDNDEAREYNGNKNLADVAISGSIAPTKTWTLWGNANYAPAADAFTYAAVGTDFWFNKRMRFFMNHAYNAGYDNYNTLRYPQSQVSTFGVRTQLWDKWSRYALEYGVSYEWEGSRNGGVGDDHYVSGEVDHGLQKQRISLIRDLDTFELAVTYAHNYVDNDWTVYCTLTPKNWLAVQRTPDSATSVTLDQDWHRYAHQVPDAMNNYAYDASTPAWQ